jgi:hypothetical protein
MRIVLGDHRSRVAPVQEVGFELGFAQHLERLVLIELREHAHGPRVGLLRALGLAIQCQCVD